MIRSLIPARLDRLEWSRFHTRLVVALGVAWILDGLEITIASNVTSLISTKQALNLSSSEVAFAVGTVYLLGEVAGALFFGRLSDKWGRRNLFMVTLGVYLFGGLLSATDLWPLTVLGLLALGLPVHRRNGNRWRVRRHQLRYRRADPGEVPRTCRHRGEWHLLGWSTARHRAHAVGRQPPLRRLLLARRLPLRASTWCRHLVRPKEPPRESTLAAHARKGASRRGRRRQDRIDRHPRREEPRGGRRLQGDRDHAGGRTSASSPWPTRCSCTTRVERSSVRP